MYHKSLQEPWFSCIKHGTKRIEGRLNKPKYNFKAGSIVVWNNDKIDFKFDEFKSEIEKITVYKTFKEMLSVEGLNNVLPTIKTIEDGVKVYRQYFSEEDELKYGVIAIKLKLI